MSRGGWAVRGLSPAERIAYYSGSADPVTGCVLWQGALNYAGYGVIKIGQVQWRAHRLAWELVHGPVPAGLVLDHLCRVRACVTVQHLEPVTDRENLDRGETCQAVARRRGTCPQGHPYDASAPIKGGRYERRVCRTCAARRSRESEQRRKVAV